MNPLEPNDPLWKLLGQSREVRTRSNFAQTVARAARNTPQQHGWRARLRMWWDESASPLPVRAILAVSALVVMAGWVSVSLLREPAAPLSAGAAHSNVPAVLPTPALNVVETPLVPEVETQLESLDYLDALLALEDTSSLTDKEIAYLLY